MNAAPGPVLPPAEETPEPPAAFAALRGSRLRRIWAGGGQWALISLIPLGFLAVFFGYPVVAMILRGLMPGAGGIGSFEWAPIDLTAALEVLTRPRTVRIIGQTLLQASLGTVLSVVLGIPGAYVLYRIRFRGQRIIRAIVVLPFVLPTVVVGAAFRALLRDQGLLGFLGWDETLPAIVAALVFFNYAVVVRTVGAFWQRTDPRRGQAAAALGAGPWRVWWRVTCPMLAPAIWSAASLVFLFCATAFGVVITLGGIGVNTVETEIWVQTSQFLDLHAAAVLSIIQLVIVGLSMGVFAWLRRRATAPIRMVQAEAEPLRWRRDWLSAGVTTLVVALLVLLPLVTLVGSSLRTPDGFGWGNYRALATRGDFNALSVTVWQALGFSVRTAIIAGALALLLGGSVSLVATRRYRSRSYRLLAETTDIAYMLPIGVSAVTLGFGLLITLVRPGNSHLLLPIAQALVAVPLVIRSIAPTMRSIDARMLEAAAVLGAGPWRVLWRVEGPYLLRAMGVAAGFAVAVSLGEFGATSFLSRPDQPTLPVVIARLLSRPGEMNYGMAMAAATVLAVLTSVIMVVAERLRTSESSGL